MDIILRSTSNPEKVEKFARAALDACSRGQKLIQQLLTFARRQTTKPVTVDLNGVLGELENLLQRTIGARVQIVSELSPGADPVLTDKVQLETAILNLVVNARDAMSDGGHITIWTENVAIEAEQPGGPTPGRYVKVTVRDDGAGMIIRKL